MKKGNSGNLEISLKATDQIALHLSMLIAHHSYPIWELV